MLTTLQGIMYLSGKQFASYIIPLHPLIGSFKIGVATQITIISLHCLVKMIDDNDASINIRVLKRHDLSIPFDQDLLFHIPS